jgi:hypothetical protein
MEKGAFGVPPETEGPRLTEYVVFAMGMAAALFAVTWFRQHRRRSVEQVALERGWSFEPAGAAAISALPLLVLSASVRRHVENVMRGAVGPHDVTVFDLADPRQAAWGRPGQAGARSLSCAVLRLPATFPHLVIEPADWSLLSHSAGLEPVGFESIEFDREFQVWTASRGDAYAIVDQRMMAWLLAEADDVRFEVNDGLATSATWRIPPERLPELAQILVTFVDKIPSVALRRFGARG